MKPKTREQNFLAKIAGDANADNTMMPRTAEEYFLNQIAENGGSGSGLPPYTSADKGKVLTLGEGEGSVEPKWETAGCVINVSGKPGSTLTPDKTYSEVVKAINKGIMPVAVLGGGSIILPYSGKKPGDILTFQFIGANTSVGGTIDGLTCVIGGYSEADGFTVAQFTVSF